MNDVTANSPQRKPPTAAHFAPPLDPAALAGYAGHPPRVGFFTDTSVCFGCQACGVACKERNAVPEDGLTLTPMS